MDEGNVHHRQKRRTSPESFQMTLGPGNGVPLTVVTIMVSDFWMHKANIFKRKNVKVLLSPVTAGMRVTLLELTL